MAVIISMISMICGAVIGRIIYEHVLKPCIKKLINMRKYPYRDRYK